VKLSEVDGFDELSVDVEPADVDVDVNVDVVVDVVVVVAAVTQVSSDDDIVGEHDGSGGILSIFFE
jgi:hypothetical protein